MARVLPDGRTGIIPALAGNTLGRGLSPSPRRDHPRSRGEYAPYHRERRVGAGSSPLSRGILLAVSMSRRTIGIIPALAGNTPAAPTRPAEASDHPRSRGEYSPLNCERVSSLGSSPLSRGIREGLMRRLLRSRIIPALAGNTLSHGHMVTHIRDHPRSRGEYDHSRLQQRLRRGSSPLSRGIPSAWKNTTRAVRIIPALAGNTLSGARGTIHDKDHPRSRGEYARNGAFFAALPGSSPLSRGIRLKKNPYSRRHGIIPALAGNTPRLSGQPQQPWDHPRSRGEYRESNNGSYWVSGSSPLSRGIPEGDDVAHRLPRIIPALAGNTSHLAGPRCKGPDHPRSRGEYTTAPLSGTARFGSSPLSRGIPVLEIMSVPAIGIIPALAGNTT